MRLLFVEDDPESVDPAIRELTRRGSIRECTVTSFAEAETAINVSPPDIVVLDVLEGGSSAELKTTGQQTYDLIWREKFCPIVVYSARPDALDREGHPFVKSVQKGRDSVAQLEAAIGELEPHVNALREAELLIRREFAFAMREVAPLAFQHFTEPNQRNDAITRSGRRRLAAQMDDVSRHGQLASWEQYLCPPVSDDLQLGDILLKAGSSRDDPDSFRVVLTPSCDLVASGGRQPKVKCVLIARCCAVKDGIRLTSLSNIEPSKLKDRLPNPFFTQGYFETILPLPALPGRIPLMVANLRDLELIPFDQIGRTGAAFDRVASVDSPFREVVAWAYMQVAARPGIPDRDFKQWKREILLAVKEEVEEEQA